MVNFGELMAEICWRVWRTPSNFNGLRVLEALLHGILVVGVSQTLPLRRWTEGAAYIRQGGHNGPSCNSCWALAHILVVYEVSREPLNGFAPNSHRRRVWSLARTSLNVKIKGQGHQGQKRHFRPISGTCVRFMFGETSLASSFVLFTLRPILWCTLLFGLLTAKLQ